MKYREAVKLEPGYHVRIKGQPDKRFEIARRTFRYQMNHPNAVVFAVRNVDDPTDVLSDVSHTNIEGVAP